MLKLWGKIFAGMFLLAGIVGCHGDSASKILGLSDMYGLQACNYGFWEAHAQQKKMKNLKVGMTKSQVIKTVGDPLDHQVYVSPNVWYYYTKQKWADGNVTRDECTPLVFKDGLLVGWGNSYYKRNIAYISYSERLEKEKSESSELGEIVKEFNTKAERKKLKKDIDKVLEGKGISKVAEKPQPAEKKPAKKSEPSKPAPKPVKPSKPEPTKPKPVKPEPKPVEPAKPKPVKPAKPKPVKPETKPEPKKPETKEEFDPNRKIDIKIEKKSVNDILKGSE